MICKKIANDLIKKLTCDCLHVTGFQLVNAKQNILQQSYQMRRLFLLFLTLSLCYLATTSQINSEVSLAVTVYNNQFAIVKDVRSISFDKGRSDLFFTDVSSNIQTETVTFKALTDTENIRVYEQNYQANLINTNAILQKYINKNIEIYAKVGQNGVRVNGTLLGYNNGYILKTPYGIEAFNNIDAIEFPSLPEGFFTLPTLNWKVFSNKALTTECEVAYRTTGFSWKADYSMTLNGDQTKADFGGWVTIDNYSGKRYSNAKLKLIAGDVNTVSQAQPSYVRSVNTLAMATPSAPTFSEKSFSDFHMYTLSEVVTLNENSQKQVEFIPKVYAMAVRKYNYIQISAGGRSQSSLDAANKIQITNSKSNKLGLPLPKGTVRVFKEDKADGSLEFIGEDSIDHTPKDQNFTLTTGNAFDITANKIASNYQSFQNSGFSADLNLTVWNHKDISAEIVVQISNYYGSNDQFSWKNSGFALENVSAQLIRLTKVFSAGEKFSFLWSENYRK